MKVLTLIQDKIDRHKSKNPGRPQVIIFDIDDTLIDCRYRKLRIFQEFIQEPDIQSRFPEACQLLATLSLEQVCFRVSECLRQIELDHPEFEQELTAYWRRLYFTTPYLLFDEAFPNAVEFVHRCLSFDCQIVFLTGRDEPGMGEGTRRRLTELGFPFPHERVQLILKPDPSQSDLEFKKEALARIDEIGHVIATFENELRNLNMMAEHYPDALLFYRQTLQSPNPPEPHHRVLKHKLFLS